MTVRPSSHSLHRMASTSILASTRRQLLLDPALGRLIVVDVGVGARVVRAAHFRVWAAGPVGTRLANVKWRMLQRCAEGEHGEAHEAGHGALLSWQAMAAKSGMIDLANWAVIYSSLSIHGTSVWLQSITSFPSFSLFFPPFLAIAKALALAFAFPLACACACAPSL